MVYIYDWIPNTKDSRIMKTLWTFGDSQTEGFKSTNKWAVDYVKWKGYTPKTFGEIIAENKNIELKNLGLGGSDNYSIFETYCKNIKNIGENDIVIIGWSDTVRFRMAFENNWHKFTSETNKLNYSGLDYDVINYILVNRMEEKLYANEVNIWIEFINYVIKNRTIHWCHFLNGLKCNKLHGFETIEDETKGEIKDRHFSEKGHFDLSIKFLELIESDKTNFLI